MKIRYASFCWVRHPIPLSSLQVCLKRYCFDINFDFEPPQLTERRPWNYCRNCGSTETRHSEILAPLSRAGSPGTTIIVFMRRVEVGGHECRLDWVVHAVTSRDATRRDVGIRPTGRSLGLIESHARLLRSRSQCVRR